MNLFQTVVGIDPSGRRLALVAVGGALGRPGLAAPPAVLELRADREPGALEEAASGLRDFVARNGLAGSAARLCVPADRVFTARISFPPLRDKDMRQALELELERLFPLPPAMLRFGWRRLGKASKGKNALLIVAAVPTDYLDRWEEIVSGAGLRLAGAVPSGWAVSAACERLDGGVGAHAGVTAVLRDAGSAAECTVLFGADPFFSALRPARDGALADEARSLLEEGLTDAPAAAEDGVSVLSPRGWLDAAREGRAAPVDPYPLRPSESFEALGGKALGLSASGEGNPSLFGLLGAYGAAVGEKAPDLLSPEREGAGSVMAGVVAGVLAAVALAAGLAWPAALAWRTKAELQRLDAQVAALAPAVARVEEALDDLADVEGRIAILKEASAGRGEPLLILKELTDRLPQGTYLVGLRVESRKVEIDGYSPSSSEIFPVLTREGRFRGVEFASPITRQPDNQERFQIRAEFVPPSPPGTAGPEAKP